MGRSFSLKEIDLVIFDMDGVMFDTEKLAEKIWFKILTSHNLEVKKEFLDAIKGRNILDSKKIFNSYYETDIDFIDLKNIRNKKLVEELRCNGVPLKKGIKECLEYLRKENKLLAVASSSDKKLILDNLKDTKLLTYFNYIVSGEDFEKSKPNPDIFLNVAKYFNIDVKRCVVIEDSKAGVEAALNANMNIIWIPDLVNFEIDDKVIKFSSLLDIIDL